MRRHTPRVGMPVFAVPLVLGAAGLLIVAGGCGDKQADAGAPTAAAAAAPPRAATPEDEARKKRDMAAAEQLGRANEKYFKQPSSGSGGGR